MEYFHLTTPQQNIWNLQKYYEGTAISNLCGAVFYNEKRDRTLLRQAVTHFIKSQSALRLRFCGKDDPRQYVAEEDSVKIPDMVFASMEEFDAYAETFAKEPLGLDGQPMYRFAVLEVAGRSGLLILLSHLISDAWTFGLMLGQLDAAYRQLETGAEVSLLPGDYTEFIRSETAYLQSGRYERDRDYWEAAYADRPEESPIKLRTKQSDSVAAGRIARILPFSLERKIAECCREYQMSEAVLFETALVIYLSKINSENRTVTVGVPVLNRSGAREKAIAGMFVSTLPLTVAASDDMSALELAGRIAKKHMELFRHQKYPYSAILKNLREKQNFSGNLYDVMISFQNARSHAAEDTTWYGNGYCEVPFALHIDNRDDKECHTVNADYQTEVLGEGAEAAAVVERLEYILGQITENFEGLLRDVRIVSPKEREKIICEFNDTYVDYPRDKCVHELFSEQAERTPEKTALVFEGKTFTYRQLDETSNALAHFLRGKGVGRNEVVPVIARRSWHVVVAMLGILKAGGAYMPVDPDYPADRIAEMLEISESRIALIYGTERKCRAESIDLNGFDFFCDSPAVENRNSPEDAAYVIFTSGSTGVPKGVTACHRNVCNYLHNNVRNTVCHEMVKNGYGSIVSVTNIVFDIFVTESLLPLLNGMCIYFANDAEAFSQGKLARLVERNHIDVMQTTPTKMKSFIFDRDNTAYLRNLKAIILGGEAFPAELYHKLKKYTDARIYNIYGPAETTVWSANTEVAGDDVTIGKPIANTQIYILDKNNQPLPIGAAGELCIAGDGVGKGYLNRPELTAERFVQNPFAAAKNRHGKIMYRTGDLARWRADGEIEYLGRIDTQVKIRGLRIELGEIESVMGGFDGIGLAAAADQRDEGGRQYLAGYYTSGAELDEKELRGYLSAKLPRYMVPNYFMRLEKMPMTPSGKIDRKRLPAPEFSMQETCYAEPVTDTEARLAKIWQKLLGIERVGRTDDFFALGGDSLLAITMLNEIESAFDAEISGRDIIEEPLLERLAGRIERSGARSRIPARHENKYVLLPQQKAIYAYCRKYPDTLAYNMPVKICLPENIDRDRLRKGICQAAERHKLLRSHIETEGNEIYGVYDEDAGIVFEECESGRESAFVRPFDLEKAPLFRVGFTEDAMLFDMHHIIADGASLDILLRDIALAYDGHALPDTEITYADYAGYFYSLDMEEHKAFYKKMLICDFEPLSLPETKNAGQGGQSRFYQIPAETAAAVKAFTRLHGLTETMTFLGAYGILLSKYTAKKDVLSSVILQNRLHADTRNLVGMFVNTLPVYLSVEGTTKEYMREVKELASGLLRYQELPFWDIANAVGMQDKSVVNTAFVYQGDGEKALHLCGQRLAPQMIGTNTAKFDLTLELVPLEAGVRIRMEYDCAKYDGQLIDRLAEAYIRILSQLEKEKISDISVLSEEEYRKVIEEFNDTYVDYPRDKCVHELFSEQAERTPEKTALVFEGKTFTYRQLDAMSNALAHFLRGKGVGRNEVVPVIARRSWHVVVAMLGILKAGGAYMPVDPDYPLERIAYMLHESKSGFALTDQFNGRLDIRMFDLDSFDFGFMKEPMQNKNVPSDTCYVLYTSGTTGTPKGVCISHQNLVNFVSPNEKNPHQQYLVKNGSTVLACIVFSFDVSIYEIFFSLLSGLCIVLANDNEINSPGQIARLIKKNAVDIMHCTPTRMQMFLKNNDFKEIIYNMKVFVIGGEKFTYDTYRRISACTDAAVFNGYGPTETTIGTAFKKIVGDDITIGKPISNTQFYILDAAGNLCPIGAAGELCIAGDGVGKGYLNRPELTAERFVQNPFAAAENRHGKIMYRTGDLARWRTDGEIEYLGRIDTQVKIRGLRIELGEIESVMGGFDGIGLAAAADQRDEGGRQYLAGYYTSGAELDEKELRGYLSAKLPRYMVPNYFMRLEKMPMTPSGKIDRKRLPVPEFSSQGTAYAAPETETERVLGQIWAELLERDVISRADDFFACGGDSLTAITMLAEIEGRLGVRAEMKHILEHTVLCELAECLDGLESGALCIPKKNRNRYPLTPQQKAIYLACSKSPESLVYNMPMWIRLPEGTDPAELKRRLEKICQLHPVLRSAAKNEGNEVIGVIDENAKPVLEEADDMESFVRPFDLGKAPLIRAALIGDGLAVDIHHMVCDGDSVKLLLGQLFGGELKAERACYADYAEHFRNRLESGAFSAHIAYFKKTVDAVAEPLALPEIPASRTGGSMLMYPVEKHISDQVRAYAASGGLTETGVYFGAFGLLLWGYAGAADFTTGIILSNRGHFEIADTVGMFVNTIPYSFHIDRELTWETYADAVGKRLADIYQYQELPFLEICKAAGIADKNAVNTAFVYQPGERMVSGLDITPYDTHTCKLDLSFQVIPQQDGGCRLAIEFDTAKYDERLISAFADSYIRILGQLAPGRLLKDFKLISSEECRRTITEFNDTYSDYPREKCVHELFAEQAEKTPDKTALIFQDRSFTYRQLDELSDTLAHYLREEAGIEPNAVVPVIAGRSWHVVVAMLGILKAGGAYMPVDPDYPMERIAYMIREAESGFVLTWQFGGRLGIRTLDLDGFDFSTRRAPVQNRNMPADACYVLYTSGTTGTPKGVSISHQNLVNFVSPNGKNTYQHYAVKNGSVMLACTVFSFDISLFEIFLSLLNGLCVVLADEDEFHSPLRIAGLIRKNMVDIMHCTPTRIQLFLNDDVFKESMRALKVLMIGAEKFTHDLYHKISAYTGAAVFNGYGPTETTIGAAFKKIVGDDITIGKPISNTQFYILDAAGAPCPIGVPGELCIAGDGVGRGYLNRPELTAERFVQNPFAAAENRHGKIMYRTGDLARWRADGEVECLGRIDTQVKIRGLRIELGEIERVMGAFDGIRMAVAADKRDSNGRQYLAGYYTSEKEIDEKQLRSYLLSKLPRYMAPNYFMRLAQMPVTPGGKTDRRSLPEPETFVRTGGYTKPATQTETVLCRAVSELFDGCRVGADDDFFALGGDSLSAMQLSAMLSEQGITVRIQDIYEHPVLSELGWLIDHERASYMEYHAAEFEKYRNILKWNRADAPCALAHRPLGNVLLTGASGFLGAHLLDALAERGDGVLYCLVRDVSRFCRTLEYYFGQKYADEIGGRILPVTGDITDTGSLRALPQNVQTVIHAAADVRHYGAYAGFERVNVTGTKNMLDYARAIHAQFAYISTTSVGGAALQEGGNGTARFSESDLFIGQSLDHVYIRSKFEAERLVLDAIISGMSGRIFRVGNLTNRSVDGMFQPNYAENAFWKRLKAFWDSGMTPDVLSDVLAEMSPVDKVAEAVILLMEYADEKQTAFHVANLRNAVTYRRLSELFGRIGMPMPVKDTELFRQSLNMRLNRENSSVVNELNEMDSIKGRVQVRVENHFTDGILSKAGFAWTDISEEYLRKYAGFFKKDRND